MFVYGGVGKDQKLLEDMNVLHIPDVKIDRSKLSTEMDEAELAAMHEAAAKAKDGLAQQINQNLYVITISLSLSLLHSRSRSRSRSSLESPNIRKIE